MAISAACIPRRDVVRRGVLDALPLPDTHPKVTRTDAYPHRQRRDATGQPSRAGLMRHDSLTHSLLRCANDKDGPTRHSPDGPVTTSPDGTSFADRMLGGWNVVSTAPSGHGAVHLTTQQGRGLHTSPSPPPAHPLVLRHRCILSARPTAGRTARRSPSQSASVVDATLPGMLRHQRSNAPHWTHPPPLVGHKRTRSGRGSTQASPHHTPQPERHPQTKSSTHHRRHQQGHPQPCPQWKGSSPAIRDTTHTQSSKRTQPRRTPLRRNTAI